MKIRFCCCSRNVCFISVVKPMEGSSMGKTMLLLCFKFAVPSSTVVLCSYVGQPARVVIFVGLLNNMAGSLFFVRWRVKCAVWCCLFDVDRKLSPTQRTDRHSSGSFTAKMIIRYVFFVSGFILVYVIYACPMPALLCDWATFLCNLHSTCLPLTSVNGLAVLFWHFWWLFLDFDQLQNRMETYRGQKW